MNVLLRESGGLGYVERNTDQKSSNSKELETLAFSQNHKKHLNEHGGQIYQTTKFSNEWIVDKDGKGSLGSSFEALIGTDENRMFVEANMNKATDKIVFEYNCLVMCMLIHSLMASLRLGNDTFRIIIIAIYTCHNEFVHHSSGHVI